MAVSSETFLTDLECCSKLGYYVIGNKCYWCSTPIYINSGGEYVTTLTDQQVLTMMSNYGIAQNDILSARKILTKLYTVIFETNKLQSIVLDINNQPITNERCCELRGGVLQNVYLSQPREDGTPIMSQNLCVIPAQIDPCDVNTIISNNIVLNSATNQPIPTDCCNYFGAYTTDGQITVIDTINNQTNTISSEIVSKYIEALSLNGVCFKCPINITISNQCFTIAGQTTSTDCLEVVKDGTTNTYLNESCCIDYGFTWNPTKGVCYRESNCSISSLQNIQEFPNTDPYDDGSCDITCYQYYPNGRPDQYSAENLLTFLKVNNQDLTEACCTTVRQSETLMDNNISQGLQAYYGTTSIPRKGQGYWLPRDFALNGWTSTQNRVCYECPPAIESSLGPGEAIYDFNRDANGNVIWSLYETGSCTAGVRDANGNCWKLTEILFVKENGEKEPITNPACCSPRLVGFFTTQFYEMRNNKCYIKFPVDQPF
jgi:hypothetical protein